MPPKRKHSSVVAQKSSADDPFEPKGRSKKRIKKGTTTRKPRRSIDTTVEWKVRDIIGETKTHYHIDWEDDSLTGEKYDPTWEIKEFANELAVAAWEAQKTRERAAAEESVESAGEERRAALLVKLQTTPERPRKRARKVLLSSPEDQASPAAGAIAPNLETDEDLEIDESQPQDLGFRVDTVSSPLFEDAGHRPSTSPAAGPRPGIVRVPEPSPSWQAGAYEKVTSSQLDHSSHQPASPRTDSPQQGSTEPSQYFTDTDYITKARQDITSSSNVYGSSKSPNRLESNNTSRSIHEGSTSNNTDNHRGESTQPDSDVSSKVTQGSTTSNVNSSLAEPSRTTAANSRNEFTFIVPDSQSISESASFVPCGTAEDSRTTDTTADHSGTSLHETLDPAVTASRADDIVEVNATAELSIEKPSSPRAGNQAVDSRDSTAGAERSASDSPRDSLDRPASLGPELQPAEEARQSTASLQDRAPPHSPIEIHSSNPDSTGRSLLDVELTSQIDESTRPDRAEHEAYPKESKGGQPVGHSQPLQHPHPSTPSRIDTDPTQSGTGCVREPASPPVSGSSTAARSRRASESTVSSQHSAEHTPKSRSIVSIADGQPVSQDHNCISLGASPSQHATLPTTPGTDFQTQLPLSSNVWRSTEVQQLVDNTSPAAEEASEPIEDRVSEVGSQAILRRLPDNANLATPPSQQASATYHHRQWTLSLVTNSSFPFQTQRVDLETPGDLGTGLNFTVPGIGRQPSAFASGPQSEPAQAPLPDYTRRLRVEQLLSSSPIPPVPSQSIEAISDSAPQALNTLSSVLTTPTRPRTGLKPSQSPSQPRTPFAARLKAKKEARRAQREAQESASVRSNSVVSAMEPARTPEASVAGSEPEPKPSTLPVPAPQPPVEQQAVDIASTASQPTLSAMEPATSSEAASIDPKQKWRITTPPPIAPTSHKEGAASDAPVPILTVEPASALPAHMASPAYSGSRSPSVVPAERFIPAMTREEQNESERYYTLVPQASQDSTNGDRRESLIRSPVAAFNHPANLDAEHESIHEIPIALIGHQRDQHYQTLYYHQEAMQKFLQEGGMELQLEADAFCDRLRRILLHPDLDNAETMTQYNVEPIRQMQWDVNCSAKFHFLFELIRSLDDEPLHIAIVAGPGRIVNMLDTFLTGLLIPHDIRSDSSQPAAAGLEDKLRCSIIDTDAPEDSLPQSDFVIVLDPRIRCNSPMVKSLRRLQGRRGIAPVVSLIVPYSLEHIEHSISSTVDDATRWRTIINNIYQMREEAGRLEEGIAHPATVATAVARYFTHEAPWTVASLDPLDNLTSQTESEIECAGSPHAGTKRPSEAVEDVLVEDAAKRPRLMQSTEENEEEATSTGPQEIKTTHVSDSVSQSVYQMADDALDGKETERKLRDLLKKAQDRTDEHVAALSDLQYRHEDQFKELHELRQERDQGVETAQRALERMNEQASSLMSTKAERNALREQLEEANTKLLSDAIPERAELEAFRLAAERANAEKTKADARVELMKRDLAFAQQQYQNSSQSASQLASQVSEMEMQLADLTAKASGEQARLRSLGYDAYVKNLQRENKQLKARLQDRELALKFKDEEIARMKEAGRGRMGTRNSSVPRSPRLGSPMKFAEGVSRGSGGGGGSRQASPAAGELRARGSNLNPTRGARY